MKTRWYKDAVIYQIYPRSFCDSNGDGIGDIRGIISKLDYLQELGVTAVWLSPCYKSPNDDNGYDISDYRNIMDEFGTLEDWQEMVDGMHARGIKLVMDLVVNHSSDEHKWFLESKKSKDNPYRDYYIWRDGKGKNGKKPPNNWSSRFTGSAWEYDETTKQWYLHLFSKKQPDLNWDNPNVRREVAEICKYWFEKGVDGFRCDVITYIGKDDGLPNGKFNPVMCGDEHFTATPKYHKYLKELNKEAWSKYDTLIVGEATGVYAKDADKIIHEDLGELDSCITFEHLDVDMKWSFFPVKLNLPKLKKVINSWQTLPDKCWPTLYYENHDQPRSVSRYSRDCKHPEKYHDQVAKMLAISLHMQKGTPYIFEGEEIGMTNIELKEDEYIDIMATRVFKMVRKIFPPLMPLARFAMKHRARDHARTPMQWSAAENAGFSSVKPWMKVNPNYVDINVEKQINDPNSVFNFYKKLIAFRLGNQVIISGSFKLYYPKHKKLMVFEREFEGKSYFTICNFTCKPVKFNIPSDLEFSSSKLVLNNYDGCEDTLSDFALKPYEARVYELTKVAKN